MEDWRIGTMGEGAFLISCSGQIGTWRRGTKKYSFTPITPSLHFSMHVG
jgi:hypothetical protein